MHFYTSKITNQILENCEKFGDNILLEDIKGQKITGFEYKNLAFYYAEKLKNKGIKKGDSVVIFIKNIIDFSAYSLAVLLVGAKFVIIEPDYSEKILEEKLKFIKPDLLVIEGILCYLLKTPFIKKISKIRKYNSLLKYSKKIIVHKKEKITKINNISFIENDLKSESLVVFTGGTTGNPKGVVHTLESLEIMFERITKIIGNNTKIFYADLPHFVLMGISMGVKTIVGKNDIGDKNFLEVLGKYKVDTIFSPPYRYINIVNSNQKLQNILKHILLGSAPVYKSFLGKLYKNIGKETKVTCIYGMTEILPVSYVDGKEKIEKKIDGDLLGKVIEGINVKVLQDGELELSGKGLFKKYLNGEIVKKHKTGDIVEYKDGNLIMKARKKDMILRKDYNIYPSLYEPIINSIPGVVESAMVGVWDENLQDEKIVLFLETSPSPSFDRRGIKNGEKLKKIIDKFALPDEIIFLDKIPRTGRQNKIDKNYLRKNYEKSSNNMK